MALIEFTESLNIRSLSKYFNPVIKKADYSEDIKVVFHDGSTIDLAGFQILYAMSKELKINGRKLVVEGLSDTTLKYFNILNNNI